MKSPYEILGVTEEQSQQEIEERYKELKAKYGEQRFAAGEEGFEGAKKLGEVEDAYKAIKFEWEKRRKEETYGSGFEAVEKYVKEDLYDDAQEVLNSIKEKNGEWHYHQALVYYKRDWMDDAYTHLKEAVKCEPDNAKFKSALDKMKLVIGNPETRPSQLGADMQRNSTGNCLNNCCNALCCAECLLLPFSCCGR